MTRDDFKILVKNQIIPQCLSIMNSKGLSYSGKEDSLANFKRCAKLADTSVEKTWLTYYIKHQDALCSYIREEYSDSEPIEGRIIDLINYLMLFYAIVTEKKLNKRFKKSLRSKSNK